MKTKKKDPPIPRAYRYLNYNPPPDFPPPDWMLDRSEALARKWRSPPETTKEPEDQ